MRDVKSLAAEIEAVTTETLAEAIRRQVVLLRFNEARTLDDSFDADEIELLCIRAANAVKDQLAAEIAANQSRAFEDGARWMRGVAAQRVVRSFRGDAPTDAERYTLNEAVRCVRLLPLQPEGERSDA